MLVAAVVGNLALYQEYLAQGARPAYAMAADHLLPKVLTRTHHKYGTPWVSIVFLAAVNALLVRWGFQTLIVIDVFLMMFYYILIFVAAVALRGGSRAWSGRSGCEAARSTLAAICAPAVAIADHRAVHERRRLAHRRAGRRAHRAHRLPRLQAAVPAQELTRRRRACATPR